MEFCSYENLIVDVQNQVATITLNRPKALNALSPALLQELDGVLDSIAKTPEIRVVVVTGAGEKAFVAGADIAAMQALTATQARNFAKLGMRTITKLERMPQPTIAAVNGFALGGGCELALACDVRVASQQAKFGQPEVNLGVVPGFGGSQRLPRIVGAGIAKELIMTGDMISADRAYQIGLANHVVEADQLLTKAYEIAKKMASRGPLAVRTSKELVNNGLQMDLDRALEYETDLFGLMFSTEDQKEGMAAFLEKRPAQFQDR